MKQKTPKATTRKERTKRTDEIDKRKRSKLIKTAKRKKIHERTQPKQCHRLYLVTLPSNDVILALHVMYVLLWRPYTGWGLKKKPNNWKGADGRKKKTKNWGARKPGWGITKNPECGA